MENKPNSETRATMSPSGRQYEVKTGQSLLEAGLGAGVALPFGCANGSCGDCRARVLSGQVRKIRNHDFSITEAQKLEGYCLLCSTTAVTDVMIEGLIATSVSDIPEQQLQAKLCRIEHRQNVSIIAFKFVRGKALRFLPGQQVNVTLKCGNTITLPIASCPCDAQYVEFHLTADTTDKVDLSRFVEKSGNTTTERERVNITGPTGHFTLSSEAHKSRLFIAEGSQFSRLQGMIEQVLNDESDIPCCLLWKATEKVSHYRSNLCRSWHDAFDHFDYVPVANDADALSALPKHWHAQLHSCEVYLGGNSLATLRQLAKLGVASDSIFYPETQ